jgi:hypothetical protein
MEEITKGIEKLFWVGSGAYSVMEGLKSDKKVTKYLLIGLGAYSIFRGVTLESNPDSQLGAGANQVPPGTVNNLLVNAMVAELGNSLRTSGGYFNPPRCQALRDMANDPDYRLRTINDTNFVSICNKYFDVYKSTLRQDILGAYTNGCPFGNNPDDVVLQRMSQLNVV